MRIHTETQPAPIPARLKPGGDGTGAGLSLLILPVTARHMPSATESGRYWARVSQHGCTAIERFATFAAFKGQCFNYGLTRCKIERLGDDEGDMSVEVYSELIEAYSEGATHWSNAVDEEDDEL